MSRYRLLSLCLLVVLSVGIVGLYLFYGMPTEWILLKVRLPRFLLTLLTGMILAGVGSTYQVMLNNPLADPYILGISAGGAFFASLATVLGLAVLAPVFGFAGSMVTMLVVWSISHFKGHFDSIRLLLSGIIAGMFFSACLSLLLYLNQQDTALIINILLGNLGHIFSNQEWWVFLGVFVLSMGLLLYLHLISHSLELLMNGDLSATSLGLDVRRLRQRIFILCSILTGITVAYAGIIGFVGLIIPHLVRLLFGTVPRTVFPIALWAGAVFILGCDFLATHLTVLELPVGILTAFIGCPLFAYLMIRK